MNTRTKSPSPRRIAIGLVVSFVAVGSLLTGCGSSGSSDDESPTPPSEAVVDDTSNAVTSGDVAVDEVESDLASLDADLQIIDEALAELEALDTIAP
jgi:outer membrane murein-binding lipoprotein Lpp